jgi:alkanesulfonate monooxygenase SsuD/methylene tetrahydromethanopterin reductase-like flavin-dependent oxidoreductase (luciferase family)
VRYAVGLPNLGELGDVRRLVELGVEAERRGWDGVFLWDHVQRDPGQPVADPWIALAAIAHSTERVRLGALITPLARRRPHKVARETASLDLLSEGRLVFGAGLGSRAEEFATFGDEADPRVRAAMLDEGLEVLAGLWSGEPFSFTGEHFTVRDAQFLPTPLQRPRPPVWIGGRWPSKRPFRRAARWDGVFPLHHDIAEAGTMSPEQLAEIVAYVDEHRDDPAARYDVVIEGYSDGSDPAADFELVERYREVGLTWWIERLDWFRGPLDEARTRLEAGPPRAG